MTEISSAFNNETSRAEKLGQSLIAELSKANPDSRAALSLIKKGADINARDENGNTPLIIAASWALIDIASALVQYGAKRNLKNATGDTAADVAYMNGYTDMLELLDEKRIFGEDVSNGMAVRNRVKVFSSRLNISKR